MTSKGSVDAIVPDNEAGDDVQPLNGILSPGFINAHCHIELSHMKAVIPEHTGLVEFVKQIIYKRENPFSENLSEDYFEKLLDIKHKAMSRAVDELYNSGTIAVGDICNTADSVELKKDSPLYWHNFVEVSGFVDAVAAKRLATAEDILLSFIKASPKEGNSLSPHAPYSVSAALFKLLNEKTTGQLISIHNQETLAENELYINKTGAFLGLYEGLGINIDHFLPTGKTSIKSWLPYFNNDQQIISVHNTFTSADDIAHNASPISYCVCINANLYIENCLPPLDMLLDNGCHIVLGTDSYASNWQLNIFEEIKSIQQHFPHIGLEKILKWATSNGARALGIDDFFGSFEKGKKPGLVLIDGGVARRMEA